MSLAVVFPGQGSQRVGMGRDWLEHEEARAVFEEADSALDINLSRLCFEGPEEDLRLTANQQPAILTVSYAIWRAVQGRLPRPAFFAGDSLGEYTALTAAGALSLFDAVQIVHERGRLMQLAVPAGEGAMAAVVGLAAETITMINHEVSSELNLPVESANFNSPEQTVVSGSAQAVMAAIPRYQDAGAKRVVELPVSAPFHSALMVPAADGLKPRLEQTAWRAPDPPVIANLTVQPYPAGPAGYPLILHAQIFNPVRWAETVLYFAASGVTHLCEVGPGKVLRTLVPKITKSIATYNIETPADLAGLEAWAAGIGEAH